MDFSSRALRLMQYVVAALMVSTIALLVWHHYGMERVIVLSADGKFPYEVLDDALDHGGSIVHSSVQGDTLRADCTLVKQFDWPYCTVRFKLGQAPNGLDMTDFDSVTFDIRYTGPGKHALRMYLRNFEPGYSTVNDINSQKINEIQFDVPASGVLSVPFSLLHTASWWVKMRNLPLQDSAPRTDNVTALDLSTGADSEMGQHRIELRSITFRGKWISQNHLLMIIVGAWFTCGVLWPLLGALHLRSQLRIREARLAMLSALNQALQLETRELAGQAFSDPLTGTLNRQGLRDALVKQWQTPTPHAGAAAVIFMDLDHFKRINDSHGHPAGDDVLRRFAAMVRSGIRSTDKLVRWGGEEFLIVCAGTSAQQAELLAEKLRAAMPAQHWPHGLSVTCSFGVTELGSGEDIGEAIKRADDALYRAKKRGRNCVEVAYAGQPSEPAEVEAA